jgi:hypothetical protein
MQNRKYTAWKKNRKFGDKMGGRTHTKLADKVFHREHNLTPPTKTQETPIFLVENPSRDFYFPITIEDVQEALAKLPQEHTEHLTHIWLQKIKKMDYLQGKTLQACFICGGGVYLIVFYPFPTDLKMRLGKKKPLSKVLNFYSPYTNDLKQDEMGWYLQWEEAQIKRYYIESLLLHEVGHSIDCFYKRYWSKTQNAKKEKWAENYAAVWADSVRDTYEPTDTINE